MSERGRRLVVLAATLAFVALAARLGLWQLDRADHKRAVQALLTQRPAQPPLAPAELAHTAARAQAQHYRRITLQGRWQPADTVFLDNRRMAGHVGFIVVTPLRLADGSAVLVQRGWVPRDPIERTRLPRLPLPGGEVEVNGLIAPPPARLYELGAAASGPIRQYLDLAGFAQETGLALRPLSLLQQAPAASDGLVRDWVGPPPDIQKHLGYAFQWFALSALAAGLYVWFQLLRPRLRRSA